MALEDSVAELIRSSAGSVHAIAHDLHPDFFSTELAISVAQQLDVPAIGVQHHHAHIGAVIAAHQLERPVIGLALDGVGLGTDGHAWGGELLWVDGPQWARLGHFMPLALPGGDRAAREPWRMAASLLHACGNSAQIVERFAPIVGAQVAGGVAQMLDQKLNCPMTSSAGRWFDAVAGILGLCVRQQEEAQAAQALERCAQEWLNEHSDFVGTGGIAINTKNQLDPRPLFRDLIRTPAEQSGRAAARFHLALCAALADWVIQASRQKQIRTVCLAGGCFYNQILSKRLSDQLTNAGLEVLLPGKYGCGDAGLAIGQAWVASQQMGAGTDAASRGFELCV